MCFLVFHSYRPKCYSPYPCHSKPCKAPVAMLWVRLCIAWLARTVAVAVRFAVLTHMISIEHLKSSSSSSSPVLRPFLHATTGWTVPPPSGQFDVETTSGLVGKIDVARRRKTRRRRDFDVYSRQSSNGNTHPTPKILRQQLTTHCYLEVQSIFRLQ